jgi:hypothetical protein
MPVGASFALLAAGQAISVKMSQLAIKRIEIMTDWQNNLAMAKWRPRYIVARSRRMESETTQGALGKLSGQTILSASQVEFCEAAMPPAQSGNLDASLSKSS